MSNKEDKEPKVPAEDHPSEEDEWEDENPSDEEEGIIIEDGMELEFDEDGELVGAHAAVEDSVNTDMKSTSEHKPKERPPYIAADFLHHMEEVVSLSVNPANLGQFASGGMDDQLVFWEQGHKQPTKFFKFKETVAFVEFGFDGKMLAAATLDNVIHVFEQKDEAWAVKFELASPSDEITVSSPVDGLPQEGQRAADQPRRRHRQPVELQQRQAHDHLLRPRRRRQRRQLHARRCPHQESSLPRSRRTRR